MSKAIVNKSLRLIESDIDRILSGIVCDNSKDKRRKTNEIISSFSSYITTIPEYSSYADIKFCNISGRHSTIGAGYKIFPVILTPYNLRLLETCAPRKIYSLENKEFLWNESWDIAPEIYRDIPDKSIFDQHAKFLFDINKIYEQVIPSCFGSLYPHITEEYDEWLREKLTHGDPRVFEDLKERVCDYWKFELQSKTKIIEYRHALFRLNKEEMEKDYPKLYEATMNHIKGGYYSFADRESKFGTRITNKEMKEYVESLKRIIDV